MKAYFLQNNNEYNELNEIGNLIKNPSTMKPTSSKEQYIKILINKKALEHS